MFSEGICGLDIGFESIKAVATRSSGGRFVVTGYHETPLDKPIIESDKISDKDKVAQLIRSTLSSALPHSIRTNRVTTVMPEFLVFSKTIQLPKMDNEKELKSAAISQMSQFLPIPLSDLNIDAQVLTSNAKQSLIDVLVAATPKAVVAEYVELFRLAGLEIVAVETKAIAATRAVVAKSDLGGLIILEIGTVNSRLAIVDRQIVRFVATINVGGNQLIRHLIQASTTQKDFLKAKYQTGIKGQEALVESELEKIRDGLVSAIRYHQSRDYEANRISEIRVCGSGALIPGICPAIQKQINIKTNPAKYFIINPPTGLDQRYTVALGLALIKTKELGL